MNETVNPMAKLYAALAKAQGQFLAIEKNRAVEISMKTGGRYKFRYADLEEILTKTRPALSSNGLALIQRVVQTEAGPILECSLMHADGGVITSEVQIPGARELADPKAFGAAITYHRRYLVTAMLGVAADDDLDEDGQEIGASTKQRGAPQPAKDDGYQAFEEQHLANMREAAMNGSESLSTAFSAMPKGALKTAFWQKHQQALKAAAHTADVEMPA